MNKMASLPQRYQTFDWNDIYIINATVLKRNHLRTTDLIYITVDGALLRRAWLEHGVKDILKQENQSQTLLFVRNQSVNFINL